MPGWADSTHQGCGSLVPPMLWVGSTGFTLWVGSRGAARGSPWVHRRGGCSDCWVLGSSLGGRVGAWGGTRESRLRHGHGGRGHAASCTGPVALEGEREQQAAAAGWGTPSELLPCVPHPAAEEHSASFMPQLPGLLRGLRRLTSGLWSWIAGRCSLCAASFSLQHPAPSPASANLPTPPCLALGASKAQWELVWDAGLDLGSGCVLWGVRGISAAPGSD